MCAIIDKNAVGDLFAENTKDEFKPFFDWVSKNDGYIVYGGTEYKKELSGSPKIIELIQSWKRAGKAGAIDDTEVDAEEERLKKACHSNDTHIIALARVSGARVLVLRADKKLEEDFKNRYLISDPKGRIYKKKSHRHLLHHDSSCRNHNR